MRFVNLTPYKILLRAPHGTDTIVEPSGTVAECPITSRHIGKLKGIPLVEQTFGNPTGIPEKIPGVMYITSNIVAQRANRSDIVTVGVGRQAYCNQNEIVVGQLETFFQPAPV